MAHADVHERVVHALLRAVDQLNRQLPKQARLEPSLDTVLPGPSGTLDSLGLINFIVIAEQELEEEFGVRVSLTDETTSSRSQEVLLTLKTLSGYLFRTLEGPPRA